MIEPVHFRASMALQVERGDLHDLIFQEGRARGRAEAREELADTLKYIIAGMNGPDARWRIPYYREMAIAIAPTGQDISAPTMQTCEFSRDELWAIRLFLTGATT